MADQVALCDCPPGLFLFKGRLGFKTEYATESPPGSGRWQPDAYVVASGEYFQGGASTQAERAALMVEPFDIDEMQGMAKLLVMAVAAAGGEIRIPLAVAENPPKQIFREEDLGQRAIVLRTTRK